MFYYTHTSPIGKKLEIFFKICINFLKKKIYSNLLHFLRGRVDIGLIFNCSPRFIRVFIVSSISYRTLTISKFCVWPPLRGRNRVFLMWVLVGETLVVWLFCCLSTFYNLHSFLFLFLISSAVFGRTGRPWSGVLHWTNRGIIVLTSWNFVRVSMACHVL